MSESLYIYIAIFLSHCPFEISDLNYLLIHVYIAYMVWVHLAASEAMAASEAITASKQPLASDLKSGTPITYLSMCILLTWSGLFWWPQSPVHPPNSLRSNLTSDLKSMNYVIYFIISNYHGSYMDTLS